jgi:N-acetylmuramic acid 6-phosphate (MurNAc-6-P) etherase
MAIRRAVENAEDNATRLERFARTKYVEKLRSIAASGTTPYVIGGLYAHKAYLLLQ